MTHTTPEQFKKDINHATQTENHFAGILAKRGYLIEKSEAGNPFFDIKAIKDGIATTFELKEDMQTVTTGNVAVEINKELNGQIQPSGLSISTSDFYVVKIAKGKFFKYFFVETEKLRKYIENKKFQIVKGGDENRSNLILIPENLFYEQCDLKKTITLENEKVKNICNKIIINLKK